MKTLTLIPVKSLLITAAAIAVNFAAIAQKLPNVQKTSVYAPANVKTDGKTAEWSNKFEAQNNATQLYYTMANDNEKLYLTLQGKDAHAISKMMNGGITLTIKSDAKEVKPVVIELLIFVKSSITGVTKNVNTAGDKIDSVLIPANQQIAAGLKEIGVKNIQEIPDTLISAYNEYGIKEAVQYDNKKALTCEFAIPLKYISPLITAGAFKYNVRLNAIKFSNVSIVLNGSAVAPGSAGEAKAAALMNSITISDTGGSDTFNNTDFSSTYVLVKK